MSVCVCVCVRVCVCVCARVCMCVCLYVYLGSNILFIGILLKYLKEIFCYLSNCKWINKYFFRNCFKFLKSYC